MTTTKEKKQETNLSANDDIFVNDKKVRIGKREVLFGIKPYTEELLALLRKNDIPREPSAGQVVEATFLGTRSGSYLFDFGYKDFIFVDAKLNEQKYLKDTEPGTQVSVLVTGIQNPYLIKGSVSSLYEKKAHTQLQSLEEGESVTAFIKEMNPAGYDLEIQHNGVTIPAFMPNTLAGINKLYNPESIVGTTLNVMIESFSDEKGTYIVSRRKYLQSLIPSAIKELEYGKPYTGHVTGTTPFGVFVEFNECLTGMIHKTNILEEYQDRISEIKPGTQIEFYIKEIIKDNKIILTQILKESLWDSVKVGMKLDGVVRDLKPFGALVQLDEETMGLIHTSELEKSTKKVNSGDTVSVKVLATDRSNRKLFLSVV